MWRLRVLLSRVLGMLNSGHRDAELSDEIDEHLRALTDEFIRRGIPPAEAASRAQRQFGSATQLRENDHETRRLPFVDNCWRDFRYGFRLLHKKLAFSILAISVLALGIGANTAVYSVAKGVVFAPLPFPRADRLALIFEADADEVGKRFQPGQRNLSSVRPGTFQDWRQQSRSFESMAATQNTRATILESGRAYVLDGFRVGDGFFETLGVAPVLGRYFTASDYAAGEEKIVVLAHRLWRERYNADASIIGREVVLDGASHRVVGVMPPGFLPTAYGNDPQFWTPLRWDASARYSFFLWGFMVYARLKDGVTFSQAQSEMDAIAVHMRAAHPSDFGGGAIVAPLRDYLFGGHDRLFALLLAAVGLVLLIACANVANLLLARGLERQREFAVRSAIGASRGAILRQMLAESLVIAIAGGLIGAALSPVLTRPVLILLPAGNLPRLDQVKIDPGVLLFTALISILAGLAAGVAPAIQAGSGDLALKLKTGGRGSSSARHERRLTDALMVAEIAFSLVLLTSAGLLTRAFLKLLATDPGFRPQQTVALQLSIPNYRYGAYEEGLGNLARQALYWRLEESVQSLAGVQAAGLTRKIPILQFWNPDGFSIEGRPPVIRRGEPQMLKRWGIPDHGMISYQTVSAGYFAALRMPLVRGRMFDNRDRPDTPFSTIINQAMVRKFFPDEDPIGRRIAVDRGTTFLRRMTIVGIVADTRLDGLDQPALPEVFAAMSQLPTEDTWIIARASADADSIASVLQKTVHDIDPEVGIVKTATMTNVISDSLWRERLSALLVGLFAILAAAISACGLYAVISQAVERRTQEMGVRLALGADRTQIARAILGHGFRVTAAGAAIGTLLTLAVTRLLVQQAFAVRDLPWILAAVIALLSILTLAASWVPLRRALSVDPNAALRAEGCHPSQGS
jgi:putative ABC transport system permease protein